MRIRFMGLLFLFTQGSFAAQTELPNLDFNSALRQIITRSMDVKVQQSTLQSIESKNIPTKFFYFPQIFLSGRLPAGAAATVFPMQRQLEINSQWNLLRWGADIWAASAANYEETAQRYTVQHSLLQAETDAIQSLLMRIQRAKEVNIHGDIVQHQTKLSKIAQERYHAGYLSIQEVEKIAVDLANAQAAWMDSKMNEVIAQATLESQLGHSHIQIEWPWVNAFRNLHPFDWKAFDGKAEITRRPDWLAAESKVKSLDDLVKQNIRLLLPPVDLQFSYGYYSGYFGSTTGWMGYLSFSLPLFDHLTRYSRIQQQIHLRAASEAQLEQTRRKAQSEWKAARSSFKIALGSALSREETLQLSRKLYADNQRRFQLGRVTSNDLAIDRSRMYQAELNAVQGWSSVHLIFTNLCHSLGLQVMDCWPEQGG